MWPGEGPPWPEWGSGTPALSALSAPDARREGSCLHALHQIPSYYFYFCSKRVGELPEGCTGSTAAPGGQRDGRMSLSRLKIP